MTSPVYTPLKEHHKHWQGVLASGVVGSLVDSAVFLWLAFGSLSFLVGQFVGKTEITLLCAVLVCAWDVRKQWSTGVSPALMPLP